MKVLLIQLILIIYLIESAFGGRLFWRGRKIGDGFLGSPNRNSQNNFLPTPDEWFEQKLDHFNVTNTETWKQRYFVNKKYFTSDDGPVFLMIGGEGEASSKWMNEGAWIHYAKKYNALCFQLEHRFYGKSHPTSDLSNKNLVYLTTEQALADLANFINAMKTKYNLVNNKWIAFGGSYPGSLAAWLRQKYPHLVHGSISSSGPLKAVVDFYEYYTVVAESLATYSIDCVEAVRKGMDQIETLLKHMIGQRTLNNIFKLCDPVEKSINNKWDIENLFENIASNFAGVVQYNKDNSLHALVSIDNVCDIMMNTTIGPQVNRLAEVNNLLLTIGLTDCLDYKYDKMIEEMKNISWTSKYADGTRQWTYQTCTEFGFYQTSSNKSFLFGDRFPVELSIKQCQDIFNKQFDSAELTNAVANTNINYGALDPETTNVLYVHGSIDPWHALGLTSSSKAQYPTIYIEGTAHCANMYEPRPTDSMELIKAREQIESYINNLLN